MNVRLSSLAHSNTHTQLCIFTSVRANRMKNTLGDARFVLMFINMYISCFCVGVRRTSFGVEVSICCAILVFCNKNANTKYTMREREREQKTLNSTLVTKLTSNREKKIKHPSDF